MPTTLLGLAVLIVLLGPGFCYVAARERKLPSRLQSPFRESVQIAAASIVLNLLALGGFWIARSISVHGIPDVGALVRGPHHYWLNHYRLVLGWSIGLFAFACGLGFASGTLVPPSPSRGTVHASAWWHMFEIFPRSEKWVGCELLDGAYISGQLYSYSLDSGETGDRELIIRAPEYQAPEADLPVDLRSALTTVSARQIKFLSVNYQTSSVQPETTTLGNRVRNAWRVLRTKETTVVSQVAADPVPAEDA